MGGCLVVAVGCVVDDKDVGIEDTDAATGGQEGTTDATASGSAEEGSTSGVGTEESGSAEGTEGSSGGDDTTGGGVCPDPNPEACVIPPEGFEVGLETQGGCSNVIVWASDETLYTLEVQIDGMQDVIGMAEAAGEPVSLEIAIGEGATARLLAGSQANELVCNDAVQEFFYLQYSGESGTVNLVVDPPDENGNALVDVTVTDVSFAVPKTSSIPLASYVWTDVLVGWLPG